MSDYSYVLYKTFGWSGLQVVAKLAVLRLKLLIPHEIRMRARIWSGYAYENYAYPDCDNRNNQNSFSNSHANYKIFIVVY